MVAYYRTSQAAREMLNMTIIMTQTPVHFNPNPHCPLEGSCQKVKDFIKKYFCICCDRPLVYQPLQPIVHPPHIEPN